MSHSDAPAGWSKASPPGGCAFRQEVEALLLLNQSKLPHDANLSSPLPKFPSGELVAVFLHSPLEWKRMLWISLPVLEPSVLLH